MGFRDKRAVEPPGGSSVAVSQLQFRRSSRFLHEDPSCMKTVLKRGTVLSHPGTFCHEELDHGGTPGIHMRINAYENANANGNANGNAYEGRTQKKTCNVNMSRN